jgi:hypothetical protein
MSAGVLFGEILRRNRPLRVRSPLPMHSAGDVDTAHGEVPAAALRRAA